MTMSIRARLLLWVIGGTALLLAAFAFVVFVVMCRSLLDDFDALLISTARTICGSIEQDGEKVKIEIDESEMPEFYRTAHPDHFQVWQEDGNTIARSPSLKGTDLEYFAGLPGSPVFRSLLLPNGQMGRAVGLSFVPRGDEEAKALVAPRRVIVVVARQTSALESTIAFLRLLLIAATGGTVTLSLLVGAIVVRQGLRPLDAIAARIAAIRQDDLSTRISSDRMPVEIVPVVQRLNDLLRRLEEAFLRERAFTSDAAHELRTPLAGMRSTLEVTLMQPRSGGDYRQAMEECLEIVCHTQAMADTLLVITRLEGGQTVLRPEELRLVELVETAWRPHADSSRARGVTVEIQVPIDLTCTTDRDTLHMVLANILANAAEYTNDGGHIAVAAALTDGCIELMIENTGCQLSEEEAQHVFERFWRGDASRAATGTHCGLGLALVQRAVILLGGTVFASVEGDVFTIHLSLPSAPAAYCGA